MAVKFHSKGDWKQTYDFLEKAKNILNISALDKYAEEGLAALRSNTPMDTGLTSDSWRVEVIENRHGASINYYNDNIQNGVCIAIILQYGHATKNGSWIEGRDFINPAIAPIFDDLTDEIWKEVTD